MSKAALKTCRQCGAIIPADQACDCSERGHVALPQGREWRVCLPCRIMPGGTAGSVVIAEDGSVSLSVGGNPTPIEVQNSGGARAWLFLVLSAEEPQVSVAPANKR